MVREHVMTRALGRGTGNLDRLAVWEKDIPFYWASGEPMNVWIVLGGFLTEPYEVDLPNNWRVTDAANGCSQNYLEKPTSETVQIKGSPETHIK